MDRASQYVVFQAQAANVRRLASASKQVRRTINSAIRRNDVASVEAHTLVAALLYCAWLEALFDKLIHTPHGLELSEIEHIKDQHSSNGISAAWKACIVCGLRHVSGQNSGVVANIAQQLNESVDRFVQEPAGLRNKIAHGQWAVALNRPRTALNPVQTEGIANLSIVEIDRWLTAANHLAAILEAMIESPERTFHRDYWVRLEEWKGAAQSMEGWNSESRASALRSKSTGTGPANNRLQQTAVARMPRRLKR